MNAQNKAVSCPDDPKEDQERATCDQALRRRASNKLAGESDLRDNREVAQGAKGPVERTKENMKCSGELMMNPPPFKKDDASLEEIVELMNKPLFPTSDSKNTKKENAERQVKMYHVQEELRCLKDKPANAEMNAQEANQKCWFNASAALEAARLCCGTNGKRTNKNDGRVFGFVLPRGVSHLRSHLR